MNHFLRATAVAALVLVAGCSSRPAGPRVDVTIGQQLIELKEAHAAGAITTKEWDKQRKRLIESFQ